MFDENRASLTNEYGDELIMTGWTLKGTLQGITFEALIEQSFVNSTGDHAEITYSFPMPWGAELLGLEARIGDKVLKGSVIGKKESEVRYEEALSEGDSAILLERNQNRDYTLNLGGIKPEEKVLITLRYGQLLRMSESGLRLTIPTTIAPRFGDPILDAGLKPHQVTGSSIIAEYPLSLEIHLVGNYADATLESPSHHIRVGCLENGGRTISLAKAAFLDRDFVLSLSKEGAISVATVVPDFANPANSMVLAAFRPKLSADQDKPVNVKILVDCSGSMNGDSIEAARRSLQAFVHGLSDKDRFSLSKFGDVAMHRSKGLWSATEPSKLAAQRWISSLNADLGGTEMVTALIETFELSSLEPADVLLVTDGDIHSVNHVIQVAKESKHRLFIVGIGSSPTENNLRRMAEETFGACDFVAPGEDVAPAVTNMFTRLRAPVASNLSLQWPGDVVPLWQEPLEKMAFEGDTVYAFARFEKVPVGPLVLSANLGDNLQPSVIGTAQVRENIYKNADLSRLAMARFVNQLIDSGDSKAGQKQAEVYQLVTNKTNLFMMVDRGEDKADVMPELHKVAQMMPAGFSGNGSVRIGASYDVIRASPMGNSTPFGDFSQYDLPPAMRSARNSVKSTGNLRVEAFVDQGVNHYDIPAFLRKDVIDKPQTKPKEGKSTLWNFDVEDNRLFLDTIDCVGMTPLGVREWVRHNVVANWPKTFAGLVHMGIPEIVVDWLELLVAAESDAMEAAVVASFLYAFVSPTAEKTLANGIADLKTCLDKSNSIESRHDLKDIPLDVLVYADVLKALEQSVKGAWPVCIFNMNLA